MGCWKVGRRVINKLTLRRNCRIRKGLDIWMIGLNATESNQAETEPPGGINYHPEAHWKIIDIDSGCEFDGEAIPITCAGQSRSIAQSNRTPKTSHCNDIP